MLNRISEWVKNFSDGAAAVPTKDDDFVTTITALLIEAAMADGALGVDEQSLILHLLTDQLEVSPADAQTMLDEAYIQHCLREKGYEIRCDGLDVFPTTSRDLRELIYENCNTNNK